MAATYAYGAVFTDVGVDELLRTVRVAVYDAGRVINPQLAHSQAVGAAVASVGLAPPEAGEVDDRDGRVVNANMSDYLVPVNPDTIDLDAAFPDGGGHPCRSDRSYVWGEEVTVGVPQTSPMCELQRDGLQNHRPAAGHRQPAVTVSQREAAALPVSVAATMECSATAADDPGAAV